MTTLSKITEYSLGFQNKVLGALLTQREFLINISDSISSEYFENSSHKFIIDFVLKYFKEYHTIPTVEVMSTENKKIENEILRIAVNESLRDAYKASEARDLEYIEKEFTNFCINQQVKKAIMTSVELLEAGDYDGIKQIINNAMKAGQNKNLGHDYNKDTEQRYREEDRSPIPYPWKIFNDISEGGYGKGELVLIFGNPKGGKSWTIIDMAAYAAKLGHNVVYYTLELSEGYVGKRIDAYLTGIAVNKLKEHRKLVDDTVKEIKGRIKIKSFPAGRATLDSIESHLDQLEQQEEFIPEAIYIDYLDLLKNRNKSRKQVHEDIDDIYVDARGLAIERGIPLISPSQMGRAGANDDISNADKISGSYKKIMICDMGIGLSRKRKDKMNGTGRFTILGNRMGGDGQVYNAKIDTSNGHIEIDETPLEDDFEEKKDNKIDKDDRNYLKKKFYELSNI